MFRTVIFIILVLFPAVAFSKEIEVTRDSDLKKTFKASQPGDVFILEDGVWKDVEIRIEANGTETKPIEIKAKSPGKVIMTGDSTLRFSGEHIVVSGLHFKNITSKVDIIDFRTHSKRLAKNCRVTNCAITEDKDERGSRENRWISIYGSNNRLDHCFIAGKKSRGTTVVVWVTDDAGNHLIDNNHFGHRPVLGKNGGETIRIGDSDTSFKVSKTIVEKNLFERCDGEGEIVSNKSCENIYRQNTFLECSGALTLRHGNRCLVEENFFLGNKARGTGGVRLIGTDHTVINNYFSELEGDDERSAICFMNGVKNSPLNGYFQVENSVVAFNTFYACKVAMTIGMGASKKQPLVPKNCFIVNNLFLEKRNKVVKEAEPEDSEIQKEFKNISLKEIDFKKDADGILRPEKKSSKLTDVNSKWTKVTNDIDGQPRDKPLEIGCDQFSDKTRGPLNEKDAGPSWMDWNAR